MKKRKQRGTTLVEFGPALVIFIVFFFVPLLDFGIIPIRLGLAYGASNIFVHRLGLAEKMSDANNMIKNERWWSADLKRCGVEVKTLKLALKVLNKQNQETELIIPSSGQLPPQYQPDSKGGNYIYYLQMTADLRVAPLFQMNLPWKGIPGFTSPAPLRVISCSAWENLGRDPDSQEFYINL